MLASSTNGISVQSVFDQHQLSQEQRTKIVPSVCSNLGRDTECPDGFVGLFSSSQQCHT
jgi:hypothetical protein